VQAAIDAQFHASQEEIDRKARDLLSGKKLEEVGEEGQEPFVVKTFEYVENEEPKQCVTYRIVGEPDPKPEPKPPPPPKVKGFEILERNAFIEKAHKMGIKTMDHPDVIKWGLVRRVDD
jgi:hypothetical protein